MDPKARVCSHKDQKIPFILSPLQEDCIEHYVQGPSLSQDGFGDEEHGEWFLYTKSGIIIEQGR